ncbi:HsdM family class I SAM-dependent methyltransferase [Scleromatobacter humisilvae]|uniref:site-specific DNA-methyltransferase (adenine-specific) n=1 Tax=Scleromatobacter humisilvae TaxID=2897159 RepID=A0A9X1YQP5_9BURK|nr:class I SAM-dependent DNA methyltransferase [Scleromatobacter humisilvae]MCK9689488.1 type I restriction-modification system subunit M [Scleromatobacter humisilvae]
MLELKLQRAIDEAVRTAGHILRGAADVSDFRDFVLAMLLLKYLSDSTLYTHGTKIGLTVPAAWVVPEGSDFYTLHAARHQAGNGKRIDDALRAIEDANPSLRSVFQGRGFNSTALGNYEQKDRVLSELLTSFQAAALDFRGGGSPAADAVAFACDSLIRQAAEVSGRRGGEFFTPPEISRLIAGLLQPEAGESVCDPCCGSGTLLLTCSQLARAKSGQQGCALYGQEKNGSTWALAKINMVLHGEALADLAWGDTLRDPKLLTNDGRSLLTFDVVVSSPPFSLRDWGHENAELDAFQRYGRGVPPRAAGDYAFISHMVETLKPETGRMAAVVSLGVLFRGGAEQQIRERLLQENLIDAVIALPAKMLPHTGIPVALFILRRDKLDNSVLFIDASRDYQHGKTQNLLREEDIARIQTAYQARHDVERYARLVPLPEILHNDSNLSVGRYVDATEDEAAIDVSALRSERAQLNDEMEALEARLAVLLREVGNV